MAIVGSRSLQTEQDYRMLCKLIESTGLAAKITTVVSGGADGVDTLAERWAEENNKELKLYLPNYAKYGKAAPIIRNKQIVSESEAVIAYMTEGSKGTANTIKEAKKQGKATYIKLKTDTGGLF